MGEYAYTPEVVRVAIVVGVVLSIVFYERFQLTTGGAIVPAYLALSLQRPLAIIVTVLAALTTYLLVAKVIAPRRIIYGRRKFEVELLIGLAFVFVMTVIAGFLGQLDPLLFGLSGIGFLVPGIIAHDMGRQLPSRTILALGVVTVVLIAFIYVFSSLTLIAPGAGLRESDQLASVLGYPRELILYAAALSVILGTWVFSRTGLRSGGFITGAYLALVSPRWVDVAFSLVVAVTVYLVVAKLLMPRLLIFGRRKLSAMIMVGSIVGWLAELAVVAVTQGDVVPWRGLTVATLMVPSLLANDMQRQGIWRTVLGGGLTGLGVYAGMNLAAAGLIAIGVL
jgi:poly-gamma-glutamate biosynthesis protein PgsC/CapC